MKNLILSVFFLFSANLLAQDTFTSDYIATYDLGYPIFNKRNVEQMILLFNTKSNKSYFTSSNRYSEINSGSNSEDLEQAMKYNTAFPEEIIYQNDALSVFEKIIDYSFKYYENPKLNWTITNETKKISGIDSRKAVCEIYGRKWIAWYSLSNPFPYGPYKFFNLPGLITAVYDSQNDFAFILTQFKKKNMTSKLPTSKSYKLLGKEKLNQLKYDIYTNPDNFGATFKTAKERESFIENAKRVRKQKPLLDIDSKIKY